MTRVKKAFAFDKMFGVIFLISAISLAFFIAHDIDEAILLSDRIYLLTGQPGRITDEIVIQQPKPRAGDFRLTMEFLAYKKRFLERL